MSSVIRAQPSIDVGEVRHIFRPYRVCHFPQVVSDDEDETPSAVAPPKSSVGAPPEIDMSDDGDAREYSERAATCFVVVRLRVLKVEQIRFGPTVRSARFLSSWQPRT